MKLRGMTVCRSFEWLKRQASLQLDTGRKPSVGFTSRPFLGPSIVPRNCTLDQGPSSCAVAGPVTVAPQIGGCSGNSCVP